MNIIIAGDGKVGSTLTRLLSAEGHNITLIDTNARVLEKSQEQFDVMGVHGNCAAMDTLLQAGVKDAQYDFERVSSIMKHEVVKS